MTPFLARFYVSLFFFNNSQQRVEKQVIYRHLQDQQDDLDFVTNKMVELIVELSETNLQVSPKKPLFVVARDPDMQTNIRSQLQEKAPNLHVFLLSRSNLINLTSNHEYLFDVVVTNVQCSSGYTMTQADTMITCDDFYVGDAETKSLLEARLIRPTQTSTIVTSYVFAVQKT